MYISLTNLGLFEAELKFHKENLSNFSRCIRPFFVKSTFLSMVRFARHRYVSLAVVAVGGGIFLTKGKGGKASRPQPIILFTDLDGTWVDYKFPSEQVRADLAAFHEYWDRVERPRGSVLVYNTARCIRMYEALPKDFENFETPDILITGEGVEIRWASSKLGAETASGGSSHGHKDADVSFSIDPKWASVIRQAWWDSAVGNAVKQALDAVDEHCILNLNDVGNALNDVGEARYAVTIKGGDGVLGRCAVIVEELEEELNGEEKVVMLSTYPAWGEAPVPHIINAVPMVAGKGRAARYIADALGFEECDCLAAGDTLGDAPMIVDTNMPFLAVGNAKDSLKDIVTHRNDNCDASTAPFTIVVDGVGVSGVLEGLKKFRKHRGEVIG
jgi:hypothetical protein